MKKLYRSKDDQKLSGVCAGLADYFDVDPTLVRAGYVLATALTGFAPGIIAYIFLAIIMPISSNKGNIDGEKESKA